MSASYAKAPLSELICGVIFQNNFLIEKSILFEIIGELSKSEYPIIQTTPPIFEEEPVGGQLIMNMNYANTGFTLYRLISDDKKWMLQIQQNIILLNWMRPDDQVVGYYPGFEAVYEKFKKVLNLVKKKLVDSGSPIDFYKQVKTYTLTYQDRIFWQEHINDLSEINKILRISVPIIPGTDSAPDNIFVRYTLPLKEINGYGVISINSAVIHQNNQLLILECRIKGKYEGEDKTDQWFAKANEIQVKSFEHSIQEDILLKWRH